MVIPGKFLPKKLYEWVKFWEKKIADSRNGPQVRSENRENDHFRMSNEIFFFLYKQKLITVFFGVKFTGDYHNVAIIPTLFRDHRQTSKKPICSSFFLLLTVNPK